MIGDGSLSNDERDDLRTTARNMLGRASSSEQVRAAMAGTADAGLWNQVVDLGWTSIHADERFDGAGYGYADVAVVLHELGRAMAVTPFLASAVLAYGALSLAANESTATEFARALASGMRIGTFAAASVDGSYESGRRTTSWSRRDGSVRLDGAAGFVLDADLADHLVVVANDDAGTAAVVVVDSDAPGLTIHPTPAVDATRRLFRVGFDGVMVATDRLLCEPGSAAHQLADDVVAIGAVAAACDAVGTAERVLELTTTHASEREQFGRPIATFQAVKHHCSNMAIAVETSRAAVRTAVRALDADREGWSTAAAITSSYVGPACSEVCALAIRVHGGIGFTWEHDAHLHLKRARLDAVLFGSTSWHRRRLADNVFPAITAAAR